MSNQNNKTLQKHLAWFRATGKMSPWLEQRLQWDEQTRNELLNEIFPRDGYTTLYQFAGSIICENPRAAVQLINLSVPKEES